MHETKFLSFISISPEALESYTTVYVVSKTYSSLCISSLLIAVQRANVPFVHLGLSEQHTEVEHLLAISFLGQEQRYWLGSLDTLSTQQRTHWLAYLKNYQGPHRIWCHTQESLVVHKNALIITLPEKVNFQEFTHIGCYLFPVLTKERCNLFKDIFKERKTLSLDAACMIMQYACVLSAQQVRKFITEWADLLLVPEHSLFTLSTLFFSKDVSRFLQLWTALKQAYSVHFWISYWSEQLFRAHQYISAKQMRDVTSAKKYAYRLPFSFIQRDWKNYTVDKLRDAHQHLYDLDFQLKQGGDECFLDLWVHEFLA